MTVFCVLHTHAFGIEPAFRSWRSFVCASTLISLLRSLCSLQIQSLRPQMKPTQALAFDVGECSGHSRQQKVQSTTTLVELRHQMLTSVDQKTGIQPVFFRVSLYGLRPSSGDVELAFRGWRSFACASTLISLLRSLRSLQIQSLDHKETIILIRKY